MENFKTLIDSGKEVSVRSKRGIKTHIAFSLLLFFLQFFVYCAPRWQTSGVSCLIAILPLAVISFLAGELVSARQTGKSKWRYLIELLAVSQVAALILPFRLSPSTIVALFLLVYVLSVSILLPMVVFKQRSHGGFKTLVKTVAVGALSGLHSYFTLSVFRQRCPGLLGSEPGVGSLVLAMMLGIALLSVVAQITRSLYQKDRANETGRVAGKTAGLVVLLLVAHPLHPWGAKTHQRLTEYSVRYSVLWGSELLNKMGIDRGIEENGFSFNGEEKSVLELFAWGAIREDMSLGDSNMDQSRSGNHFHNPLASAWNDAGLTDLRTPLDPTPLCAPLWALDGPRQSSFPEGDNSWGRIRENFYRGLLSNENRFLFFSSVFKGLGHQLHLIQDMSVPDHVRNDSHPLGGILFGLFEKRFGWHYRCIEGWAEHNLAKIDSFLGDRSKLVFPNVGLEIAGSDSLTPIVKLTDCNVYDGSEPRAITEQGLAEYTNGNFVSEDTIFTENFTAPHVHGFPYPRRESTDLMEVVLRNKLPEIVSPADGLNGFSSYISKTGDGEMVNHFLKLGYFSMYCTSPELQPQFVKTLMHDELCHQDYASMLIPRGVGYGISLINYFFRGEIELSIPETTLNADGSLPSSPLLDGAYSFTNDAARGFERMSLMARNVTAGGEEMANGTVSLVVSYRLGAGSPFVLNPPVPGEKRHFKVFPCPGVTSIPRESPARIDVDMGADPLPVEAVDLTLSLVFKGDLGGEKGCAVAVGFRDISEPTPIDLFNGTDMACFNGDRVSYADPVVVQAADLNGNGVIDYCDDEPNIIPRFLKPVCLSFNGYRSNDEGETNYYYHFPGGDQALEIAPVSSHRLFVLGDSYPAVIRLSVHTHEKNVDPGDSLVPYGGSCLGSFHSNQVHEFNPYTNVLLWGGESAGYFPLHSDLSTYRGHPFFNMLLFDGVSIPVESSCGAPSVPSLFRDPGEARERGAKGVGEPVIRRIRE